jgi:hypothetical protein
MKPIKIKSNSITNIANVMKQNRIGDQFFCHAFPGVLREVISEMVLESGQVMYFCGWNWFKANQCDFVVTEITK